jgi:translocation and assembly module TamA
MTPARARRLPLARTTALLAIPLLLASRAPLADPPASAPPTSTAATASRAASAGALHYRVDIVAPDALRGVLTASVDLVRWQSYADMTDNLFEALTTEAIGQAKEAVATEGYFSADVTVDVDRSTAPLTVTLRVTPGPQARVTTADVQVSGIAADDPEGREATARIRREWPLAPGTPFRQSLWGDAKSQAVATLAGDSFAAATLSSSEARVDPKTNSIDISLTIDSGPVFHVGDLDVQGLSRYPVELVQHYRTQKRGDRYSVAELDQFVRRLNGTGYFASVHAAIDPDTAHADDAPVQVSIIEAPPKKLEAGLGYSTDTAFRANVSYRDVDVGGRALQMYVDARLESKLQNASLRFVEPPAANGWSRSTFARVERTDISGLVTQAAATGVRMSSLDERNQWQYGAAFYIDHELAVGFPPESSRALYVDIERAWRRVDDLAAPTKGFIALAQFGVGIPGASTRGFERAIVRYGFWQPLSRLWSLTGRAEAGAVIAGDRVDIPSELLFRTGGDTSVRGYAFESLGLKRGDAILPVRYYTVASIEATRWINDSLGIATFFDIGNAFDEIADFHLARGYGIGARVRTPVGPFRLDVAYGEQSRQVRLHFSVGIAL